ncbi:helix-turn-helix domain-containing protein [Fusobacterium ulcerans]|uniref:helix-turn-helix domain-containing protein n=1 Tax=Fusobacterium ulcerans TaxID=861 RepID=UPI001030E2A3|nr:helix-turn-helix transcriptional regulator [Fusobacterium ulcerans]
MGILNTNIKKYRLKRNFTLEALANEVGTSKQTIQRYESGVITNIPSDKIEKIAEVLKVSPGILMGWEKENVENATSIEDPFITYKIDTDGLKTADIEELKKELDSFTDYLISKLKNKKD